MSIVLTGTTPLTILWNNVEIEGFEGEPNSGSETTNSLVTYAVDSQTITWNNPTGISSVPSFLNGITFNNLVQLSQLNGSNVDISRSILFQITNGSQEQVGLFCEPRLKFTVKSADTTVLVSTDILPLNSYQYGGLVDIKNISYCTDRACPSYTLQLLSNDVHVASVNSVPWQSNNGSGFSCGARPMRSFRMTAQMTITITLNCAGSFSTSIPCRAITAGPTGSTGPNGNTGTTGTTGTNGRTGATGTNGNTGTNGGGNNNGNTGTNGTTQKSWISKYWWVIVIIAAVVLIAIIVLIVLLTRGGGKEDDDTKS